MNNGAGAIYEYIFFAWGIDKDDCSTTHYVEATSINWSTTTKYFEEMPRNKGKRKIVPPPPLADNLSPLRKKHIKSKV